MFEHSDAMKFSPIGHPLHNEKCASTGMCNPSKRPDVPDQCEGVEPAYLADMHMNHYQGTRHHTPDHHFTMPWALPRTLSLTLNIDVQFVATLFAAYVIFRMVSADRAPIRVAAPQQQQ